MMCGSIFKGRVPMQREIATRTGARRLAASGQGGGGYAEREDEIRGMRDPHRRQIGLFRSTRVRRLDHPHPKRNLERVVLERPLRGAAGGVRPGGFRESRIASLGQQGVGRSVKLLPSFSVPKCALRSANARTTWDALRVEKSSSRKDWSRFRTRRLAAFRGPVGPPRLRKGREPMAPCFVPACSLDGLSPCIPAGL